MDKYDSNTFGRMIGALLLALAGLTVITDTFSPGTVLLAACAVAFISTSRD